MNTLGQTKDEITILILDHKREIESYVLIKSLIDFANFDYKILYYHNGNDFPHYDNIVKALNSTNKNYEIITSSHNNGCGIGTKRLMQICDTEFAIYCQVDQFLVGYVSQKDISLFIKILNNNNDLFHLDLSGNQGRGVFSERAHFLRVSDWLSIPNMPIGGPGPFANFQWTENRVQEWMKENSKTFLTLSRSLFADNGKSSIREYPCGGKTLHYTDTKKLFILKPLKNKYYDFPNLNLTEDEWNMVLSNSWPEEGKIPENDKNISFTCFEENGKFTKPPSLAEY